MEKVMVVDDSKVISQALKILIEKCNMEPIICNDAEKAVSLIRKEMPALVLLDIMMPKKSGLEIFKELKASPETKNIPILILTAKFDTLDWHPEVKSCDKLITKPFDNFELMEEIVNTIDASKKKNCR